MRLLGLTLMMAVVAATVAITASRPATAATSCTCTGILHSGQCTEYNCHELLMSITPLTPIRSAKDCRQSQVLVCDFNSCKLVCDPTKK
jgi:hypothetical protein